MNLPIFIHVKICIKVLLILLISSTAFGDWSVDFSRRTKNMRTEDLNTKEKSSVPNIFNMVFKNNLEPAQELVVLNTDKGFIPSYLRVKVGQKYKVTIVNVNEKDKNISFVLDAFSEHHSTYYGVIKSFFISPKKEGVYSYQCPETSAHGKLIVYTDAQSRLRQPASQGH